jgi:hypothetical protein
MNAVRAQEPRRWNARRWLLALALIFAAEVSLVLVLSWRPGASTPPLVRRTALRLVCDPALNARLSDLVWLPDPAQFATVTPHGFTAALWRETPPLHTPPPPLAAAPEWLEQPLQADTPVASFSLRSPLPTVIVAEPLRPRPHTRPVESLPLASRSRLDVSGDLRGRRLLRAPRLPVWPVADILRPTVVQALVNAAGDVLSVVLQPPGSGLAEADARALELAAAAQFAPLPGGAKKLTWGRLIFRWASVPPPAPAATATHRAAAVTPTNAAPVHARP